MAAKQWEQLQHAQSSNESQQVLRRHLLRPALQLAHTKPRKAHTWSKALPFLLPPRPRATRERFRGWATASSRAGSAMYSLGLAVPPLPPRPLPEPERPFFWLPLHSNQHLACEMTCMKHCGSSARQPYECRGRMQHKRIRSGAAELYSGQVTAVRMLQQMRKMQRRKSTCASGLAWLAHCPAASQARCHLHLKRRRAHRSPGQWGPHHLHPHPPAFMKEKSSAATVSKKAFA